MDGGFSFQFGGGVDWGSSAQEVGVHEANAQSVKEYAYSEDAN
jgi:hypothetical protein